MFNVLCNMYVDFQEVIYILRVACRLYASAGEGARSMILMFCSDECARIFALVGLFELFHLDCMLSRTHGNFFCFCLR
jgi:hypothetical protein